MAHRNAKSLFIFILFFNKISLHILKIKKMNLLDMNIIKFWLSTV